MARLIQCWFLLLVLCGNVGWAAPTRLDPGKTWVLVVGVLQWQFPEVYPSFPKTNRRDVQLVERVARWGVLREDRVHLLEGAATVDAVRKAFARQLRQVQAGETLIFYYAGHGYRRESDGSFWMAPYDANELETHFGLNEIAQLLSGFQGSHLILAGDCCHSGSLRSFVEQSVWKFGMFALSSSPAQLSSTGNWTFTDSLLDGLAGEPRADKNGDGWVSLGELAAQVERDMLWVENQQAGGSVSPGLSLDTIWTNSGRSLRPGEGDYVAVLYDRQYWKARVLETGPQGVKVRWVGLAHDYPDEWVPSSTVMPMPAPR